MLGLFFLNVHVLFQALYSTKALSISGFVILPCDLFRRFTHGHLAQLKFILPEAIVINKILVFDERTSCMKPDLRITINRDAVESDAKSLSECGSMWLRKLFRARLRDFCKSHPEVHLNLSPSSISAL